MDVFRMPLVAILQVQPEESRNRVKPTTKTRTKTYSMTKGECR
jgi:hypothetical protein